jgi:predicted DCC family thiol-disulfide oxidoreductase YuxK
MCKYPNNAELIVFYDNDCLFCTRSILLIDRLDKKKVIFFSTLRGELGTKRKLDVYCTSKNGSMVALDIKTDKIYIASDAILKIMTYITFKVVVKIIKLIPKQLRDTLYYLISNNRYILSRRLTCKIPNKDLQRRFI